MEIREEAALALGNSRLKPAVAVLKETFARKAKLLDDEIVLRALGISRQENALRFLVDVLRRGRLREATAALEGLALFPNSVEMRSEVAGAVEERSEGEIRDEFRRLFGAVD